MTSQPENTGPFLTNQIRALRLERGWTQAELADRTGISRAAVSAIEQSALAPSVETALRLAQVFGRSVEELFTLGRGPEIPHCWAWTPPAAPVRFWQATVADRIVHYPTETTATGLLAHDGVSDGRLSTAFVSSLAKDTLVVACCDPAVGILAQQYNQRVGGRLLALTRTSAQALELLRQGVIHVAGVHLASVDDAGGNGAIVRQQLGPGYVLMRMARWEEGVALTRSDLHSIAAVGRARLRWVGREDGTGARVCQDELFGNRITPRHLARDHRGVAESLRAGWADAGVCLRYVSAEAGLSFVGAREDRYDLCFRAAERGDPRIVALIETVRHPEYRRLLAELPGYQPQGIGELETIR